MLTASSITASKKITGTLAKQTKEMDKGKVEGRGKSLNNIHMANIPLSGKIKDCPSPSENHKESQKEIDKIASARSRDEQPIKSEKMKK